MPYVFGCVFENNGFRLGFAEKGFVAGRLLPEVLFVLAVLLVLFVRLLDRLSELRELSQAAIRRPNTNIRNDIFITVIDARVCCRRDEKLQMLCKIIKSLKN